MCLIWSISNHHKPVTLCVTVPTDECEQRKHFKNAPSLWSLRQNLNFLYILLSNEVISCTPLLSQTDLSFPFMWPRSAMRPRERSGLVISLLGQWSLSSVSRKGPAPAAGEASPPWRCAWRWRTPPVIIWRATAPRRRWATVSASLFTIWEFRSSSAATVFSRLALRQHQLDLQDLQTTKAKPGGSHFGVVYN